MLGLNNKEVKHYKVQSGDTIGLDVPATGSHEPSSDDTGLWGISSENWRIRTKRKERLKEPTKLWNLTEGTRKRIRNWQLRYVYGIPPKNISPTQIDRLFLQSGFAVFLTWVGFLSYLTHASPASSPSSIYSFPSFNYLQFSR